MSLRIFLPLAFLFLHPGKQINLSSTTWICNNGRVSFDSEAPLETIKASSYKLNGVVDLTNRTFAFVVLINSFEGFNSPLQKEHFNESYLESEVFPTASFKGKIVEATDFSKKGVYSVRAKGKLTIHGVDQEKIIRSVVTVDKGKLKVKSQFTLWLQDYDISIPKVINQKISPEIKVAIEAEFKEK